ncbi:MAG: ornithine cyclodeaminase family protein [Candidatus Heimdallarchaeota archaeon]|nr:MAG: ornithine cyclodeaminase family protein [Candidatus Heimdallarchaeota archaeon]
MGKVLLLSKTDVESVLNMRETIAAMETAFQEFSGGSAILPQRILIPTEAGISLYMPAFLPQSGSLAVKIVTVFEHNPVKYDLPTILGKVLLQDPKTGDVISIMDGSYLTAMRTGAVSGCAIKYLAKKDVQSVGLFGTGVQGSTQLWAACVARPRVQLCKVYDVRKDVAEDFILKMSKKLQIPDIKVVKSPEEAVKGSDIVLTATTSPTPVFRGEWLEPGTHISAIGSYTPETREIDTKTVRKAKVVCDEMNACLEEAGDLIIPIKEGDITKKHIHAELGEIVSGKKPGRETESEITLFKSVGLAIQDAATSKLVYDKAREMKKGIEVEI